MSKRKRIDAASAAGLPPERVAEMVGCTVEEVLACNEELRQVTAKREEWDAAVRAEVARLAKEKRDDA